MVRTFVEYFVGHWIENLHLLTGDYASFVSQDVVWFEASAYSVIQVNIGNGRPDLGNTPFYDYKVCSIDYWSSHNTC